MISERQRRILAFPYSSYDALICDGAVRTGKTSLMTVAFVDWAMRRFDRQRFGVCGRTVDSAVKNIIVPYLSMSYSRKRFQLRWSRGDKVLEVRRAGRRNWFEVFGGKDESSFALIQGRTLAGVLLDEVTLMPESFVNQALARCSVEGARFWFSCNPGSPNHWFYRRWIRRAAQRNALYLRFNMEDNPALSPAVLARYRASCDGLFYQRYVQGRWVAAEGLVYPMFDPGRHVLDQPPPPGGRYFISVDYGTVNPCSMGLWQLRDGRAVRLDEYYYDSRLTGLRRTDEEHYRALEALAGERDIERVIVDPSAASFKETIRRHRRFSVWDGDNRVLDGIRLTASLLAEGRLLFVRCCAGILREFNAYAWDQDSLEDAVIKENDHAMDDMRYFVWTVMRRVVR